MYENEAENCVRDYENRLRYQGMSLDMFMKYTGQTIETLKTQFRPQAEKQVKARLALEKIAELENLTASDEDINGEYARIAEAYGIEVEQVKASIDSEFIAADMKVQKAMELVTEKAEVTVK
jgi:trigger factor